MAGFSFTSQGAVPNLGISGYSSSPNLGTQTTTPQAAALNRVQTPVAPPIPAPSTPVKSTTVSHPDGTTVATTYHAPAEPTSGILSSSTGNSSVSPENTQTTGTQHPGDPGFTPIAPKQTQTSTAEYNSDGTYAGTLPAGSTANNTTAGPSTFPGILGSLTTASQNGSGVANTAANGLLQAPNQNQVIGDEAKQIGDSYGKQIAQVGTQGAGFEGGQLTTGTSPVASGNAAITAQTTAAEQQALATGEASALQGNAQQLTAQNQGQAGLTNAGSIGNTSQSNVQSGLANAGTLAQPSATYPFVFDPSTGTFKNAQTGGMMQASDAAQAVLSGKLSYADAKSALGYLGQTGEAQLQSAIMQANPNANLNQLEAQAAGQQAVAGAPYSAQASNIGTAGTAATQSFNQIYSNANAQAATYSQQQSAINSIGNQALSLMGGINDNSSQFVNAKINNLSAQFSNPKYAAFNTAVQALQARIGTALQAGEIPTAATSNAQAIANGNITVGALAATLKQIDKEMTTFVGTQQSLADYAKSQLGSGGASGGSTSDPLGIR